MAYSAVAVANEFIKLANDDNCKDLTNMKLQKLVYISYGVLLAMFDQDLVYNNVHAFEWGPVYPSLYKKLSHYGKSRITELIPVEDGLDVIPATDKVSLNTIAAVWKVYGKMSAIKLSELTHQPDTPWANTWTAEKYARIPKHEISAHYAGLIRAGNLEALP